MDALLSNLPGLAGCGEYKAYFIHLQFSLVSVHFVSLSLDLALSLLSDLFFGIVVQFIAA